MKRHISFVLVIGIIMLTFLAACAPKTTPVTSPNPIVNTPTALAPTSTLSPVRQAQGEPPTSQDAAWAKVVEAAKKEGKLTIYSYNLTGDIGIAIGRAFKERYGIQIDIVTGRGAEFIQRLHAEQRMGGLVGDLNDGNPPNAKLMKEEGLTIGIADELPVLQERDVWVTDVLGLDPKDKQIISFVFATYSLYINTNLVKPGEEPKVWKDVLNPKWKSKMAAVNPTSSAGLLNSFGPLLMEKVIDEAFLKALYLQDLRFSFNLPDEAGILSRGERSISLSGINTVYSQFITQGASIRAIELSDGTVLTPTVMVAFKGAAHPNATKVFINWFLSPEGQTVWAKTAGVASIRKDVPNFLPEAARLTPKRPVITTSEDTEEAARLYKEQWLNKLWGRQ